MIGSRGLRARVFTWRNLARLLLLTLGALIVWTTLTPGGRTTAKSAMFLANLVPGFPVQPLNLFTRDPERIAVTFTDGAETWEADLYLPGTQAPHPGMVIALGVTPAGRDDSRVQRLGDGLARMGIAALVPYDEDLIRKRVTTGEIDFLVSAYRYLAARPEVDPSRVGFLGVCVGSSLSLLAAQDPRIAGKVDFVSWFGGYYRIEELIASVVSESFVNDGELQSWRVDSLTREVAGLRILDFVEDGAERDRLANFVFHRLAVDDPSALSPVGALVHELYSSRGYGEALAVLDRFPARVKAEFRELSPATNLHLVQARLYLMDDSSDRLIPFVHTRRLADDLAGAHEKHSSFSVFSHVEPQVAINPLRSGPDFWRLFRHIDAIMQSIG